MHIQTATTTVLAAALALLPAMTGAAEQGRGRNTDFVGIFFPVFAGLSDDPGRCPDSSHPLAMTFQGVAYTTLGRATLQQSHCENLDHTSFRHGEQTLTFDSSGDQLTGTYSGQLLQTPTTGADRRLIIDGTYRNTGGTGGLEHAHGRGITAGVVNSQTGAAQVTVSGSL
jgi:hypothetical protein